MTLTPPPTTLGQNTPKPATPSTPGATGSASHRQEITPPKCFGTDYFGKWNSTGMTFESMKIDRPDYQMKCANCPLFDRCFMLSQIKIMRIKK